MNLAELNEFVGAKWDEDLVPQLIDYVRVPAKSPAFDASWDAHGHLRSVVKAADQYENGARYRRRYSAGGCKESRPTG